MTVHPRNATSRPVTTFRLLATVLAKMAPLAWPVSRPPKSRKYPRSHPFCHRHLQGKVPPGARLACAFLISCLQAPTVYAGEPFTPLEEAMSRDEQLQSGIDRLTPEERNFLNQWLKARFGAPTGPSVVGPAVVERSFPAVQGSGVGVNESVAKSAVASKAVDSAIEAEIERRVAVEVAAAKAQMEAQVAQAKAEIKADNEAEQKLEPFEARIVGGFNGWSGSTVFTLDNGQVWRQRHGSSYRHTSGDTRVKFDTNWLGMWEMTVLTSGRTAAVKRLD